MFFKLSEDKKVFYFNNYIILINFIKNQTLNPSVIQGIEREFANLPLKIKQFIQSNTSLGAVWGQSGLLNLTKLNLILGAKAPHKPMEEITYEDLEAKTPKKYAGKSKLYKTIVLYYMDLMGKTGNALAFFPAMKEIYELYLKDFPNDTDEEIIKEIKARIDIAYRHYEKAKCNDWGLRKIAENWELILTWK